MNQNLELRKEKMYCKYCKGTPTTDIPDDIDLSLPASDEFIENVRCTICKTIGYISR